MFQSMLARSLQWELEGAEIAGEDLPEWGMTSAPADLADKRIIPVRGHRLDLAELVATARSSGAEAFVISSLVARLSNYERHLGAFRELFAMSRTGGIDFSRHLVVNVRLHNMSRFGRKPRGFHQDYPVLPIAWYEELIDRSGLVPLFVGDFGRDPVTEALRQRFRNAEFFHNALNPMEDFRLVYSAEHVVVSPSTFSWLAAWLSPYATTIALPLAGFLNPLQRADIDLAPIGDSRYKFWSFPTMVWEGSAEQVAAVINDPSTGKQLSPYKAAELVRRHALPTRRPSLVSG